MATDANSQIFSHHASLYSRNRRPFALTDDRAVANKQDAAVVSVVASGTLANDLDSSTAGANGYATGNARYLHVMAKHDSAAQKSITVYGYNYVFGEWAAVITSDKAGNFFQATAASAASGAPQLYTYDISGIDRVAFVSADAPATVRAAASTF
jgi:hypothetical protein